MTSEAKRLCYRSIIQALAGNMEESEKLAHKAEKQHNQDEHLCLDVIELLPEDIIKKLMRIA